MGRIGSLPVPIKVSFELLPDSGCKFLRNVSPNKGLIVAAPFLYPGLEREFPDAPPGFSHGEHQYTKLFKYRSAGVREYWIVDPEKNRILVYDFESENTSDYTFFDSVKVGIYENLYINFSDIAKLLNM